MALPEFLKKSAEKILTAYCSAWHPIDPGDPVRLAFYFEGDSVILCEEENARRSAFVRFGYCHQLGQWSLYRLDAEKRWRIYLNFGPSLDFDKLLRHVDEDPLHIFRDRS